MAASKETRETDPFSVRALVRGLSILGLFDVDHREWTIDEMAEQTGLLRMTAYRMVRTLESMAFLVRDASANRYRLGPAALALTYIGEDNSELVQAARPFLDKLTKETGESVTLAVDIDGFPVCVDIINTSRPFKRRTAPGRILGDLVSVHGKLFAAYKSPEDREGDRQRGCLCRQRYRQALADGAGQPRRGRLEAPRPEVRRGAPPASASAQSAPCA